MFKLPESKNGKISSAREAGIVNPDLSPETFETASAPRLGDLERSPRDLGASDGHEQARRRPGPSPRRQRIDAILTVTGAVIIFGALLSLSILPWAMGIVKDVKHVYIPSLPTDNDGAYLMTDQGIMELFAWYIEPDDYPSDAPTLQAANVHSIAIVMKQFDLPEHYVLMNGTTGEQIRWGTISKNGTQLILTPASPLQAGEYELSAPTDGMFGGETYHYFILQ